jgi:hypothetical protein
MAEIPWDRKLWDETKRLVKIIEDDYEMKNAEIQQKIFEIVKQHKKGI